MMHPSHYYENRYRPNCSNQFNTVYHITVMWAEPLQCKQFTTLSSESNVWFSRLFGIITNDDLCMTSGSRSRMQLLWWCMVGRPEGCIKNGWGVGGHM